MYDNVKRNETSDLSLSEQSSFTTSPQTERKDHQNHQNHHQQATSNGSLDRSESPTKLGMVSNKMLLVVTIFGHKYFFKKETFFIRPMAFYDFALYVIVIHSRFFSGFMHLD